MNATLSDDAQQARPRPGFPPVLPILLGGGVIACLAFVFFGTPSEKEMGEVYKIFYFHVPSAMTCLVLLMGSATLSLAFLIMRRRPGLAPLARGADRAAWAMAEIGVLLGAIVLTTGPLWGKPAWGSFWTWEPRLTLTLLTEFLFVGYLVLRAYGRGDETSRRLSAGIAIMGIPAAILVHFAVELWQGGNHPQVVTGEGGGLAHPDMKLAFGLSTLAIVLFAAYLVWMRIRAHKLKEATDDLFLDLSDLEDTPR